MERIIVTISRDAKVKIETQGFKGSACQDATRRLIERLGGEVTNDTPTAESYDVETNIENHREI